MDFSNKVYSLTKKIPKGKITTYKEIAKRLHTRAYRHVGQALKKNPHSFPKGGNVPCHRVVCSDGSLGGYAGKLNSRKKINLLKKEGIEIKNNRIIYFEKRLFRL